MKEVKLERAEIRATIGKGVRKAQIARELGVSANVLSRFLKSKKATHVVKLRSSRKKETAAQVELLNDALDNSVESRIAELAKWADGEGISTIAIELRSDGTFRYQITRSESAQGVYR